MKGNGRRDVSKLIWYSNLPQCDLDIWFSLISWQFCLLHCYFILFFLFTPSLFSVSDQNVLHPLINLVNIKVFLKSSSNVTMLVKTFLAPLWKAELRISIFALVFYFVFCFKLSLIILTGFSFWDSLNM